MCATNFKESGYTVTLYLKKKKMIALSIGIQIYKKSYDYSKMKVKEHLWLLIFSFHFFSYSTVDRCSIRQFWSSSLAHMQVYLFIKGVTVVVP